MKIQRVLCPTDFSRAAAIAQQLAAQTAREHEAELFLYHAVPTHSDDTRGLGDLLDEYLAQAEQESLRKLSRDAMELRKELRVTHLVERSVNAFTGILAQTLSFRPDLMVIATHAGTGGNPSFLGSVSGNIIRHAPCSVWTVRPGARVPRGKAPRRILVPVDFSDGARRALEVARAIAREQDSLVVLHVVHNPSHTGDYGSDPVNVFEIDLGLPTRLSGEVEDWLQGQRSEIEIREGNVAESVFDVTRKRAADLVVVGTRGLTGVDYLMVGSVAEKIVCGSSVPVVVAKN